eukprot:7381276-Prymnesium_polylepis.2
MSSSDGGRRPSNDLELKMLEAAGCAENGRRTSFLARATSACSQVHAWVRRCNFCSSSTAAWQRLRAIRVRPTSQAKSEQPRP